MQLDFPADPERIETRIEVASGGRACVKATITQSDAPDTNSSGLSVHF